ncbi:MAG: TonB-dependent receptor plug domain-containing protein [Hyphomonadaceae bacterium]
MKRTLLAMLAMAGSAQAQEATGGAEPRALEGASTDVSAAAGQVLYGAEFFARFNPQNAYDMALRVPGFTLDDGDEERRGFSGAVGNVLIDGRRPSTKSQDLEDVLSRIPAGQVARIELIRDASSTSDAAGQSTLINIVRTPSAGSGAWELTGEAAENGRVTPSGSASWTGRTGALDYSAGVSRYLEYRPLMGERFFYDGAGALMETRRDVTPRTYREGAVNAEAAFPLLGGQMRVNSQVDRSHFQLTLDQFDFLTNGAPNGSDVILVDERRQNEELGFNYDRAFGAANLELIGLHTRGHYANDESTESWNGAGDFVSLYEQNRRNEFRETIGRGTLSFPMTPAHRLDIGGEIAFNSLDASQSLTADEGAGPVIIDLPAADVLVEESRAEAFVTLVWRAGPRWTIETTMAGESSTLTQTGDTELETELAYIKPSFQLTRRLGERNQLRFRVYRDVGQLDFTDFVSSAGLADDLVVGGNPNLRPENSWRAELAGDFRFGQEGALGVRFFNHWLRDANDVVPVGEPGEQFDAPGNIGQGWVHGVQLTAAIPLTFLLPNARLTLDATAQDSQVTDPVTGRARVISTLIHEELDWNFRQDFPERRLAWGLDYAKDSQNITYRLNEIDTYEEGPFLDLWVESTALRGVRVRAFAKNLFDPPFTRRREFYETDRTGALALVEDRLRTRRFGRFFGVTVSATL